MVLSPTRELAQQTFKAFQIFGQKLDIPCVSVIGGESINKQKSKINSDTKVIIGTPGRINDLARQKIINLKSVKALIFDEADRLFDMGFKKDIEYILKIVPRDRQMIMVSATSNRDVLRTAYRFHSSPEEICLNQDSLVVDKINHSLVMLESREKFAYLVNYLRKTEIKSSFIFCNTQHQTHLVGEWLKAMGFQASYISGKLAQNKRTRLMQQFREQKLNHLVCTDVAARGLDIKNVDLVINYDLPNEAENYVHRIGRTGRAGASGLAISFCAYEDCSNLELIKEVLQAKIPQLDVQEDDFATDLCPMPRMDHRTLKLKDSQPKKEKKMKNKNSQSNNNKKDKKVKDTIKAAPATIPPFLVTTESFEDALNQAMGHFKISNPELLENKVIKKTGKKFLMFGKEEVTYEFVKVAKTRSKKPRNNKTTKTKAGEKRMNEQAETQQVDFDAIPAILDPFVKELFTKMGLDLNYEIEVQASRIQVDIRGEDIGLVLTNRKQLMYAIETILRQFLFRKELIKRQSHLSVYAHGTNPKPARQAESRYEDIEEEEGDNFGNREHNGEREFNGGDYGDRKIKRNARGRNGNRNARGRNNNNRRRQNDRGGSRGNQRPTHTDEFLQDMARILRDQVLEENESKMTKALNSYERRIVHEALHDDQRVKTESEGDGKFKQIKISAIADNE